MSPSSNMTLLCRLLFRRSAHHINNFTLADVIQAVAVHFAALKQVRPHGSFIVTALVLAIPNCKF
jgi:hypothetical protein